MMNFARHLLSIAAATSLLTGCNQTQEIFRPFDVDKTSVSADAKQRVIISAARPGRDGSVRRIVCAEPSPDAMSAIAASLGADLSGSVALPQGMTPEAAVALRHAVAEQVAYVGVRNSTIQLLRDGLYRACEGYMNGAIGDFGYSLILANYGRLMVALLTAEGLTSPAFAPPTVLNSEARTSGPADAENGATLDASAEGSGQAGTISQDGSNTVPAHNAELIAMVGNLADPHRDATKSIMDLVVACFMWAEETPMRSPKSQSPAIQDFCSEVFQGLPATMEAIINTDLLREAEARADEQVAILPQ